MQAKHAPEFAQPRFRAVLSAGFGGVAELATVAVVLLMVALLAAWPPAQRAASVDPAQALRTE